MCIGDTVLFLAIQPVPRGTLKMYTVGVVCALHGSNILEIIDICKEKHYVYTRMVKVLGVYGP